MIGVLFQINELVYVHGFCVLLKHSFRNVSTVWQQPIKLTLGDEHLLFKLINSLAKILLHTQVFNVFLIAFLVSFSVEIQFEVFWKIQPRCSFAFTHYKVLILLDSAGELIQIDVSTLFLELIDLLDLSVVKFYKF